MQTRARWNDKEWDSVCLQLYRTQPIAAMTNAALIKKGDFEVAMQTALPQSRWHRTMNMTHLRPKLQERFKALRSQLQQIEQEQKAVARQQEEAERIQAKARSRVDVFAPLVEVMAERLFARLEPMLERYVDARMKGVHPAEAHEIALDVHREVKVAKLRLGVVGLLPIQEQEVIKSFAQYPFVELNFYDKDRGQKGFKSWSANLDHVFLLTSKVEHGYEQHLERFTRVSGRGTTAMIRSIEVWLASSGRPVSVSR